MKDKSDSREEQAPLVSRYEMDLLSPACEPGSEIWSARAALEADIREVLPYLNAKLPGAVYDHKASVLVWKDGGRKFAFRPREIKAAPVMDREEGQKLIDRAVSLANEVWQNRSEIEPDYERTTVPSLMQIFRYLPRTNCGKCGFPTCMAFAAALRNGRVELECCPELEKREELEEVLGT